MDTLVVLDRLTRVAPLGLRFWDSATNSNVSDGLQVNAVPETSGAYFGTPSNAFSNGSGVFVFHHLPGLSQAEYGAGDDVYWATPPVQKSFAVTVTDQHRRFIPFRISVRAPVRKIFDWSCSSGKPTPPLPKQPAGVVPLFSSTARPVPNGLAVIRASIVTASGAPAAWAMVEARFRGSLVARGFADQKGQATLYFSYPKFTPVATGAARPPLTTQSWLIDLSIYFSLSPPFPVVPDLCTLADQARANPLRKLTPPVSLGKVTLKYGEELIVKTQSKSDLFLR
jgi:hypothetical protein